MVRSARACVGRVRPVGHRRVGRTSPEVGGLSRAWHYGAPKCGAPRHHRPSRRPTLCPERARQVRIRPLSTEPARTLSAHGRRGARRDAHVGRPLQPPVPVRLRRSRCMRRPMTRRIERGLWRCCAAGELSVTVVCFRSAARRGHLQHAFTELVGVLLSVSPGARPANVTAGTPLCVWPSRRRDGSGDEEALCLSPHQRDAHGHHDHASFRPMIRSPRPPSSASHRDALRFSRCATTSA